MWFLYFLSWIAAILQLSFAILAVAAGLYYLAEVIEEYTVFTCKIIRVLILVTMAIYGGMFLFEDFPASMIICGITSQVLHLLVLRTFPFFILTSLPFIGSVVLLVINHYLAFSYFSSVYYPFSQLIYFLWYEAYTAYIEIASSRNVANELNTTRDIGYKVLAYFTLCLWIVPFSFFVSLSANENILPTVTEMKPLITEESDVVTNYFSRRSKRYGLLSFFNYAKESILPQRIKKVF